MNKLRKISAIFFFMASFVLSGFGQFLPKDGAKLNYNQIYFEYPYNEKAVSYTLYLGIDSTKDKTNFISCLYNKYFDKTPATRVSKLPLGRNYKWYIETVLNSGEKEKSDIHYFSILNTTYSDTSLYKRKINYKSKNTEGVIWCDFSHCAYDRDGNIVWFMPNENVEYKESTRVRDIRFQKDGTVTFIKNPGALHTTLEIEPIWQAPLEGKEFDKFKNGYHHCFEKLSNGNYMALAYDYVELEKTDKSDTLTNRVELVNLIEFNKEGEIVWIWEMREHFPLDILAIPKGEDGRAIINAHCNAFSIDKENKFIYIGFRDISRVIKIEKETKKIIAAYGKKLNTADSLVFETDLFSFPHDAKILDNDQIMILNNNEFVASKISSIEVFEQPKYKGDRIKSKFSFKFNFDSLTSGKSLKFGNVKILDNGNYLINEGSINRIVEINKNKKVLWDMMLYKFDIERKKWTIAETYRIDYSTSLHPYYFSLSKAKLLNKKFVVTVFNEGDNGDSYQCELFNEKGELLEIKKTCRIKAKNSTIISFNNEKLVFKVKIKSLKSGIVKEFFL